VFGLLGYGTVREGAKNSLSLLYFQRTALSNGLTSASDYLYYSRTKNLFTRYGLVLEGEQRRFDPELVVSLGCTSLSAQ
jgi:hypothetical protein